MASVDRSHLRIFTCILTAGATLPWNSRFLRFDACDGNRKISSLDKEEILK